MSDIFSHAAPTAQPDIESVNSLPPLETVVVVPVPVEHAFAGFTECLHLWWPFEVRSCYGAGSYAAFEADVLLETAEDGRSTPWGAIHTWEPLESLTMTWHAARPVAHQTLLAVRFQPEGNERTKVIVTQSGWADLQTAVDQRHEDERLWSAAMGRYARFMGGNA